MRREPPSGPGAAGRPPSRAPALAATLAAAILLSLTAAILLSLAAADASARTRPAWKFRAPKSGIDWWQTTPPGTIVIKTEEGVFGVSPDSGRILWQLEGVGNLKGRSFEPLPYTPLAMVSLRDDVRGKPRHFFLVDVVTGEEVWSSERAGLGRTFQYFPLPQRNALLVAGETAGPEEKAVLAALSLDTGEPLWIADVFPSGWRPPLFQEGGKQNLVGDQEPLFDTDSTIVLFMNDPPVLRKLRVRTGGIVWEQGGPFHAARPPKYTRFDETPAPAPRLGYASMALSPDGACVYVPYQNTVGCFRTSDGSAVWGRTEGLNGIVTQLEAHPDGVVARSVPETNGPVQIHFLEAESGEPRWRWPEKGVTIWSSSSEEVTNPCTNFLLEEDRVVVAAEDELLTLDLARGARRVLARLDLDAGEDPRSLESRGDGYLVTSEQNLAWFDLDGHRTRHVYHPPLDDIGLGLLQLAGAAAGQNSAERAFRTLAREYHATSEIGEYVFMLTDVEDGDDRGDGLVRVRKSDGEVSGRILLDEERPDYRINPYNGSLILRRDDRTLEYHRFADE